MYSNNELSGIGIDVIGSIDTAISEVYDIEEYAEVLEALEEVKALATEIQERYSGKAYEEELEERNAEYYAMVRCE